MLFAGEDQKIQQEENNETIKQLNVVLMERPETVDAPIEMMFIPPPVNDSAKYLDQLQNDFLGTITKSDSSMNTVTLFGQQRPVNLSNKKLPQPMFVDQSSKQRLKKMVKTIYEKMIQNLKYCSGDMPVNQNNPIPKITQKSHQFMTICQQLKVTETKNVIWKLMQQQTQEMNKKSEQIEQFIEGMTLYCNSQ